MKANSSLQEKIKQQLSKNNLEVIGIQAIPNHADKMVRLSTLEEMLEEFDQTPNSGSVGYLLQVKVRTSPQTDDLTNQPPLPDETESLYAVDGTINYSYLQKNADLLFEASEYLNARSIYNTLLKSGFDTGPVLGRIAQCLEGEGNFEEACNAYERAITYLPTLSYYQHLASILTRRDQNQEAAETLERALHLKSLDINTQVDICNSSGNAWTRGRNLEKAEAQYKKALELSPSSDNIRSNLGSLYLQFQNYDNATRCFRDAIASNPENHLALSGLGSCALAQGDSHAAYEYFGQSLDLELNNATAIFYFVKCSFEIKSYAKACKILEEYIQLVPINSNLLYSLAGLQFHLGKFGQAKETVTKILELQPQHPGAKELLTLIQKYAGTST
jgi:tetratricopeptide (TPR) repeat protein